MLSGLMNATLRRAPVLIDLIMVSRLFTRHRAPILDCPCCHKKSKFRLAGLPPRINAMCPNCLSLERHRLMLLFLQRGSIELEGKDVLHFAPEAIVRAFLQEKAKTCTGCDFMPQPGDLKIDIERIALPDDNYDLIICAHVLEHVDDRKALAELRRVLRPDGTLLLLFPIIEGWDTTFEDASIRDPADRLRYFGQDDHVRIFGRDVRDRIRSAGFALTEHAAEEPDVSTYGLLRGERIFVCRKSGLSA